MTSAAAQAAAVALLVSPFFFWGTSMVGMKVRGTARTLQNSVFLASHAHGPTGACVISGANGLSGRSLADHLASAVAMNP